MSAAPLVSVVVPTLKRPQLLLRALQSVFAQTHANLEAIVVVDGPDEPTLAALASVPDPRLIVVANPRSLTAAGARNEGVARATGDWVAFLDDDDEWLPTKLERQLALAAGRDSVIVSCLTRVETPLTTYIWPLLSGQNGNNSNWLASVASSDPSGIAKSADWIGIFSNTVTERTCSNV